jgi:uncharacterized membrane protein HdeD (DUF308 family)
LVIDAIRLVDTGLIVSGSSRVTDMKLPKSLGMLLLAVWLILTGLIALFSLSFAGLPVIMGIIAIAAGVLILLQR